MAKVFGEQGCKRDLYALQGEGVWRKNAKEICMHGAAILGSANGAGSWLQGCLGEIHAETWNKLKNTQTIFFGFQLNRLDLLHISRRTGVSQQSLKIITKVSLQFNEERWNSSGQLRLYTYIVCIQLYMVKPDLSTAVKTPTPLSFLAWQYLYVDLPI